jgi:hypothetical protein
MNYIPPATHVVLPEEYTVSTVNRAMATEKVTAHEAAVLYAATVTVSAIGIFAGIFFLFINIDTAVRVAAAVLVGIVGFLSFMRHSIFYRSDQIRMGWRQDRPEFQLEVGYANLAIGFWAFVAAALDWGSVTCGLVLVIYGTYLLCALFIHVREANSFEDLHTPAHRQRVVRSVMTTVLFVIVLLGFGFIALGHTGLIHVPGI